MLPLFVSLLLGAGQSRTSESVVPALASSNGCTSSVEIRNLGNRTVTATLEAYTDAGALLPFLDQNAVEIPFAPGSVRTLSLPLLDDHAKLWARLRESIPSPALSPVLSVTAVVECLAGDRLRSIPRVVSHPARNAWFNGDVADLPGSFITVVNASEGPATVSGCYSGDILISNPDSGSAQLHPLCSNMFHELLPPFAARQFPVQRDGSTHFSLKSQGGAIVLQMLRPVAPGAKVFQVDSSISFGSVDSSH